MNVSTLEKLLRKYLLFAALLVLIIIKFDWLVAVLQLFRLAFSNIIFAAMLAYVINIVMVKIEKVISQFSSPLLQKGKRPISLLLSLIFVVFLLYALLALVIPALREAIDILLQSFPAYFATVQSFLQKLFEDNPDILKAVESIGVNWNRLTENFFQILGNRIGNMLGTTINIMMMIVGSIFNLLLIVVFSIYILLDKERFIRLYKRLARLYMKPEEQNKLDNIIKVIHQSFSAFIGGQCLEAAILGTLCAGGMFLLRMPYPLMVGTLVGVINIIPIIGAYVGGAIGMFMVFTQNPLQAVGFLVYLVILQQFESNVIYPRVVGNSVGLPGIYVLGTVMVFGSIAGIPGMFLGIPIMASIYKLFKLHIEEKEREKEGINKALTEPQENGILISKSNDKAGSRRG